MTSPSPRLLFDVPFDVPPLALAEWMTDFRADDGEKWFRFRPGGKVEKTAAGHRIELEIPWIGRNVVNISLQSPTRWTGEAEISTHGGRLLFRNHIEESVEGVNGGSLLHVRIWVAPQSWGARAMLPFAVIWMRRRFRAGFLKMKRELEAERVRGTSPT
jgi:hypothetical protein